VRGYAPPQWGSEAVPPEFFCQSTAAAILAYFHAIDTYFTVTNSWHTVLTALKTPMSNFCVVPQWVSAGCAHRKLFKIDCGWDAILAYFYAIVTYLNVTNGCLTNSAELDTKQYFRENRHHFSQDIYMHEFLLQSNEWPSGQPPALPSLVKQRDLDEIVRQSGRGTVHWRPHKIFLHFHHLWTLLSKIREGVALSPLSIFYETHLYAN